MRWIIAMLSAVLVIGAVVPVAQAEPTKDELKVRFRAREAELKALKQTGKVGETVDGYVDVVDPKAAPDEKVTKLVGDENTDRKRLYQILAEEINKENPDAMVKATTETIATRNAMRNLERAGAGEMLRVAKGQWIQAKDFPRYQKLVTLKGLGKVGETAGGMVEVVKADGADKGTISLVAAENEARTAEYKAIAEKERVDAAVVAKRMGARNFENAKVGEMLKDEGGGVEEEVRLSRRS